MYKTIISVTIYLNLILIYSLIKLAHRAPAPVSQKVQISFKVIFSRDVNKQ